MNYLAHAFLSFRQPEILVGNMTSDFIKGKSKFSFPEKIQQGIALHRAIDQFTDDHKVNARAKTIFKPAVGLYAGAFLDVAYDHFLANDRLVFADDNLPAFSQWVYGTLENRLEDCPARFRDIFPYMKQYDWLTNYSSREGIEKSMAGLVRRAKYLQDHGPVFELFNREYETLEACYQRFFPELLLFVNNYFKKHLLPPQPGI
ncbi:ACP phosphodiesterase [Flavihumibacter petaseus]|uniref:Putative acyl carrier protein phosphodiesterase n=1 Tax=Flavihumibacter petaseus NBRC 106054 TaxID=1220578 RepID=A0A0E9MZ80_9BACT|nr:ACP phosphodiesterase [Flavihumibacter petaseus]GAO42400.1 putative acyl carrier protein phosphodiesterase [Flavihumibacter petaseus NBRC 106054]